MVSVIIEAFEEELSKEKPDVWTLFNLLLDYMKETDISVINIEEELDI